MKPRSSIRRRLIGITMTTCGAALLLAGAGFVWVNYSSGCRAAGARLDSIAKIVANQATAALAFNDSKAATEILRSLVGEPQILRARIQDRHGKPLALYERGGTGSAPPCPSRLPDGIHSRGGFLTVLQSITSEGECLGSVCILSDLREIREQLQTNLKILGGLLGLSLLVALGLVSRLERQITKPILHLAGMVRTISERKDYSIRATPQGKDETGLLVEGFNEMLAQIQARDAQLEAARADLERRVEERTRELKAKEEQLIQARKMEAIGRLAGGVAHDFNNMLTGILGFSEMALQSTPERESLREYLLEIAKAARRAKSLTGQLLAFSRRQMLRPEVLDLNSLTNEVSEMLRRLLGEKIRLVVESDPAPLHILADPGQIQQVILNLSINARDVMPEGGRLTLRTAAAIVREPITWRDETVPPGDYATLSVIDTGPGLAPDVLAHLFEPFFTTKSQGQGTGLGLSTVYGIVKQSGGHIIVGNLPGAGAVFTIYFPRTAAPRPKTEVRPPPDPSPPAVRGTVLLAEDEGVVRKLAGEVLRRQGFTVVEAADGQEALKLVEADPGRFDLLVTDVMMPLMDGRELACRAMKIRPALKVLFMSGYTDDAGFRHRLKDRNLHFLSKPFTPFRLAAKVREIMLGSDGNPEEVSHETRLDLGR